MAVQHSILADLALRLAKSPEDVATEGLAYVLSRSEAARNCVQRLAAEWAPVALRPITLFRSQVVDTDGSRPDLEAHDEQGKLKEYTALELKELRGDGKLPGYAAALTDLQDGQVVRVYLARKKAGTEPKDKDKKALPADEKLLATVILIEADPQTRK